MQKLDLSIYQKNFYLEWRLDPDSSNYNTPLTFEINGPLNIQALKKTVAEFINHCENQRTYFIEENNKIKQVIVDKLDVKIEEYDLSSMDKDLTKKESDKILHDIYNHVFDLHKLPLFRYGLIKLGNEKFIFVLNYHHITCDAFSASYLIDYISGKYNQFAFGESFDAEALPRIKDYINYEKKDYPQAERDKDLSYWEKELSDVPLRVDIPDMRLDKKEGISKAGGSHYFSLDLETSNKLKQFSRANRATPFLVLSAIWALLSSRYSGQKDIIIHYPINARPPKFRGLLGCFVNTVLMKVDVDQTKSVSEFIKSVVQQRKDTKAYQRASLSDIVQSLRSNGIYEDGAFNLSIFEAFIGFVGFNFKKCKSKGVPSALQYLNDLALAYQYDVESEVFQFRLDYKTSVLDIKGAKKLELYLKNIINEFIKDDQILLCDIDLLESKERKQILIDWNDTSAPYPKDKTIYQLFEEQVNKTPNNIAVVFEDQKLSYKDLNQKSNQLAHLIRAKYKSQNKKDLKPDSLIGLCVERSLDMIIGILGILKAGAAYVPLDPDYPQDRLEYMIEDSHEGLIITQKDIVAHDGFLDKLHHDELLVIDSDEVKADLSKQSSDNLEQISGPNDLAYVIYTSGSTGKPKGVMLEHHCLLNFVSEFVNLNQSSSFDSQTLITRFVFDVSLYEIFTMILSGGFINILSLEMISNPNMLFDYVFENNITQLYLPPFYIEVFIEMATKCDSLKVNKILTGVEPILESKLEKIRNLIPGVEIINGYGPTECTVSSTLYRLTGSNKNTDRRTPIGKPLKNTQVYILYKNLNPCPIGIPGELYIGGVGLARGYLNQKELTCERFISNPFAKELGLSKSDRIYKTGDLVRWLPDGNIEYLGRTDFQVKIRGFRIELGEIENVLAKHESVSQVTVIDKEKEGQKYLAAYCVISDKGEHEDLSSKNDEKDFVHDWENLYEDVYKEHIDDEINTFDISGWVSSFTEKDVPEEGMHEWVNATVNMIKSFGPNNILEVGCGSGLLLYPLVSNCKSYIGIDFSINTINKIQTSFEKLSITNALVEVGYANQLDKVDFGVGQEPIDTIVINSVAQYFPNQSYLDEVIEQSVSKISKGRIILGDIRDYRLLDAFHVAIQVYKYDGSINWSEIKRIAAYDAKRERELLVDPRYYINLKNKYPKIKHVEILPKRGRANHEMNRFRYDVVLHIEPIGKKVQDKNIDLDWIEYSKENNLQELLEKKEIIFGVKAYPNKRVFVLYLQ